MAWLIRGNKEIVADGTGKVTSKIRKRGTEPSVLVRAVANGGKIGEFASTAEAKAAVELIIGAQ